MLLYYIFVSILFVDLFQMLPDDQRPKGLGESAIPHSVYILVGKTKKEDSAFLSLSKESSYEIKLNLTKLYPAGKVISLNYTQRGYIILLQIKFTNKLICSTYKTLCNYNKFT